MKEKVSTHGGQRDGAGRPATGRKVSLSLYLDPGVAEFLKSLGSGKAAFVERLVKASKEFKGR